MEKEGRRREVGLALLLLLLVAWELPLNTEAEAIAPTGPPSVEVGNDDGSTTIANPIANAEWTESRRQRSVDAAVDAAIKVVRRIYGGVNGLSGRSYRWFTRVWRAALNALRNNVDWALTLILRYIDRNLHLRAVEDLKGFTRFLLDVVKYPKWASRSIRRDRFTMCFQSHFPPCVRHYPPGMSTKIYCVLRLVETCVCYDDHFVWRPMPWSPITASFKRYYTPPLNIMRNPPDENHIGEPQII